MHELSVSERNFSQTRCYATVKSQLCSRCEVCTSSREKLFPLLSSRRNVRWTKWKLKENGIRNFHFEMCFPRICKMKLSEKRRRNFFSLTSLYQFPCISHFSSLLSFNLKCRASNNVLSLFFVLVGSWKSFFSSFVWSLQKKSARKIMWKPEEFRSFF